MERDEEEVLGRSALASFSVHGGTLNVVPAPQFSLGLELNPTPDKVSAEAFLIPLC